MKVMVFVKATPNSEAETLFKEPEKMAKLFEAMGKYNEQLVNAGIMVSGDGLKPSSAGKRVRFDGTKRSVSDGPFSATEELIAGYWIWNVKDMNEAVEWVKRCPNPMPGPSDIEIRPFYEEADFGELLTPELREQEDKLRNKLENR